MTIQAAVRAQADPRHAEASLRFFKTGPGEYGEGDRFLGVRVPVLRKLARRYRSLPEGEVLELLVSVCHEERLLALLIMVEQYRRADVQGRKRLYQQYLDHTASVNNWDLVDSSAEHIVGAWLAARSRRPLFRFAQSTNLWERRIAIMATFHFIKQRDFATTLELAAILLTDPEDLIHKAVGWMLREVGNRDRAVEEVFLRQHYRDMPRTMLRYAIEKFPEPLRQQYLKGEVT